MTPLSICEGNHINQSDIQPWNGAYAKWHCKCCTVHLTTGIWHAFYIRQRKRAICFSHPTFSKWSSATDTPSNCWFEKSRKPLLAHVFTRCRGVVNDFVYCANSCKIFLRTVSKKYRFFEAGTLSHSHIAPKISAEGFKLLSHRTYEGLKALHDRTDYQKQFPSDIMISCWLSRRLCASIPLQRLKQVLNKHLFWTTMPGTLHRVLADTWLSVLPWKLL